MSEDLDPADIFCERLRTAREMRKWSQQELGKKTEMPSSSIAHLETGSRKPSFATLRKLAIALDVTTDYLLGRVEESTVAQAGDPLFRDLGKLSGNDRELAKDFLKMLADRSSSQNNDK